MKPLTPKERAKIYRKAAVLLSRFNGSIGGMCVAIAVAAGSSMPDVEAYPELYLFKPTLDEKSDEYLYFHAAYWYGFHYDLCPRITALLLCEQIALSETKTKKQLP